MKTVICPALPKEEKRVLICIAGGDKCPFCNKSLSRHKKAPVERAA